MNRKKTTLTPAQLSEFERLRRSTVADVFSDPVLKKDFGLSQRPAAFAREYAITGNAKSAAVLAGYSRKTGDKDAARLLKRTARAVAAIRSELETVGAGFRAKLTEYMTAALIDVVEMRRQYPGAAVLAVKALNEIFPPVPLANGNGTEIIDLDAIRKEAEKLGIYPEN